MLKRPQVCYGGSGAKGGKTTSYSYDAYDIDGNRIGSQKFGGQLQDNGVYDASPDGKNARYLFQGGKLTRLKGNYFGTDDGQSMWLDTDPTVGTSIAGADGKRYSFNGTGLVSAQNTTDWGTSIQTGASQEVNTPQSAGGSSTTNANPSSFGAVLSGDGAVSTPTVSQSVDPDIAYTMPVLNRDGTTSYTPAHQLSSRLSRRSGWSGNILGV